MSGGFEVVSAGGMDVSATVLSTGLLQVFGSAQGTTISGVAGYEDAYNGLEQVMNGGAASDITIASGGRLALQPGATASGVTIESGGNIKIWDGSQISGLTVEAGGGHLPPPVVHVLPRWASRCRRRRRWRRRKRVR